MSENTIRWVAGLSNGETAVEGKGQFVKTAQDLSPWRRLLRYIEQNNLEIISLRIVCGDQSFMVPSMKTSYRFYDGLLPSRLFHFHRKIYDLGRQGQSSRTDYICIRAEYDDLDVGVNLYVDIDDTDKCWVALDNKIGKYDKHLRLDQGDAEHMKLHDRKEAGDLTDSQFSQELDKITKGDKHANQK
jgi:hypothetical protein